jgi:structure-specific endonuclease subunit SLX1
VYWLEEINGTRTYIGATKDVDRRLLQHNGALSGGAKATSGKCWKRVCHVSGFPCERAALQFEWAWKYVSKKQTGIPFLRRLKALLELFGCDRPTSNAADYLDYVKSLQVVWEDLRDPYIYF